MTCVTEGLHDDCNGCGSCAGICPAGMLEMRTNPIEGTYLPRLRREEGCFNCRLCTRVCPNEHADKKGLALQIFGNLSDDVLGNHINCYIGHSTDTRIRWKASSGGMTTALLIFMIEKGLIDGAVVTKMDQSSPLKPQVIIARTANEIESASGSKYCPVPADLAIRQILRQEGRFAVVGLPCHIYGFRKAATLNRDLREKIVFYIGLFCSHTVSFCGTEFFLNRMGIRPESVESIEYRGRGWPGGMTVKMKNGSSRFFSSQFYWGSFFKYLFTPAGCIACDDVTNELADISLGDAWLPELKHDRMGTNIVITRTSIGENTLRNAMRADVAKARVVSCDKIGQSQRVPTTLKKRRRTARLNALKLVHRRIRRNETEWSCMSWGGPINWVIIVVLTVSYILTSSRLKILLMYLPIRLLKICGILLDRIFML